MFCCLNRESQTLVSSRNVSHLQPQAFVPANHKKSPIRKSFVLHGRTQKFCALERQGDILSRAPNITLFNQLLLQLLRQSNSTVKLTEKWETDCTFPTVCIFFGGFDVIYQTRARAKFIRFETPRSGLKKLGAAVFFF